MQHFMGKLPWKDKFLKVSRKTHKKYFVEILQKKHANLQIDFLAAELHSKKCTYYLS